MRRMGSRRYFRFQASTRLRHCRSWIRDWLEVDIVARFSQGTSHYLCCQVPKQRLHELAARNLVSPSFAFQLLAALSNMFTELFGSKSKSQDVLALPTSGLPHHLRRTLLASSSSLFLHACRLVHTSSVTKCSVFMLHTRSAKLNSILLASRSRLLVADHRLVHLRKWHSQVHTRLLIQESCMICTRRRLILSQDHLFSSARASNKGFAVLTSRRRCWNMVETRRVPFTSIYSSKTMYIFSHTTQRPLSIAFLLK